MSFVLFALLSAFTAAKQTRLKLRDFMHGGRFGVKPISVLSQQPISVLLVLLRILVEAIRRFLIKDFSKLC
jgi:hypothetical protein